MRCMRHVEEPLNFKSQSQGCSNISLEIRGTQLLSHFEKPEFILFLMQKPSKCSFTCRSLKCIQISHLLGLLHSQEIIVTVGEFNIYFCHFGGMCVSEKMQLVKFFHSSRVSKKALLAGPEVKNCHISSDGNHPMLCRGLSPHAPDSSLEKAP